MSNFTTINIELTSRCNKNCWMCGRRKIDRDYPDISLNYGDMDFDLVRDIARQLPQGIVCQFHNNGEPLLYPRFGEAIKLFKNQIKCMDTNGKLVVEKADEIIDNLDTITISVIENDPESNEQYRLVKEFLKIKANRKPYMIYRCLGDVDIDKWKKLNGLIARRILHNPMGSFEYKKETVIPEIGICLEILNHIAINRFGEVSCCVRFDPEKLGVLGNINKTSLYEILNSKKRRQWITNHINGERNKVPLCSKCEFWGIPRG